MRGGELEAGDWQAAARSANAEDDPAGLEAAPVFDFDRVLIDEAGRSRVLVNHGPGSVDVVPGCGMGPRVLDDLLYSFQEAGVVDRLVTRLDAVAIQVVCLADQPRCLRECPYGNGAVIRCHPAEYAAGDKRCARAETRCAQSGDDARRAGAKDEYVALLGHT
jgi:hypothetical protein